MRGDVISIYEKEQKTWALLIQVGTDPIPPKRAQWAAQQTAANVRRRRNLFYYLKRNKKNSKTQSYSIHVVAAGCMFVKTSPNQNYNHHSFICLWFVSAVRMCKSAIIIIIITYCRCGVWIVHTRQHTQSQRTSEIRVAIGDFSLSLYVLLCANCESRTHRVTAQESYVAVDGTETFCGVRVFPFALPHSARVRIRPRKKATGSTDHHNNRHQLAKRTAY